MARNKRNQGHGNVQAGDGAPPQWVQPPDAKFVNVSLSDVDKQWLQDQLDNYPDHVDALFTDADKHAARVSIIPDARSGRYNATFTSYDPESTRYGLILSVRAATPALAVFALAYACLYKPEAWKVSQHSPKDLFG